MGSFLPMLAVSGLFLLCAAASSRDRRVVAAAIVILLVAAAVTGPVLTPGRLARQLDVLTLRPCLKAARDYIDWDAAWRRLDADGRRNLEPLRLPPRVVRAIGQDPVDSVPWNVEDVLANGLRWRPRPTFHTYNAYTPELDARNAAAIAAPDAAIFVLVRLADVDRGHPFLRDCLSWRSLLDWYDATGARTKPLLLRRRRAPRFEPPLPVGRTVARLGETVALPRVPDLLLARVEVRRTPIGRAAVALYQGGPLYVRATYRDGSTRQWRAVRRNLAEGFIANRLPRALAGLEAMIDGSGADQAVMSLAFTADHPSQLDPDIAIEWLSWRRAMPGAVSAGPPAAR